MGFEAPSAASGGGEKEKPRRRGNLRRTATSAAAGLGALVAANVTDVEGAHAQTTPERAVAGESGSAERHDAAAKAREFLRGVLVSHQVPGVDKWKNWGSRGNPNSVDGLHLVGEAVFLAERKLRELENLLVEGAGSTGADQSRYLAEVQDLVRDAQEIVEATVDLAGRDASLAGLSPENLLESSSVFARAQQLLAELDVPSGTSDATVPETAGEEPRDGTYSTGMLSIKQLQEVRRQMEQLGAALKTFNERFDTE